MYIRIISKDKTVLYTEVPKNPTINIFLDENEEEWIAALMTESANFTGEGLILVTGSLSECHECVNKILLEMDLKPIDVSQG